MTGTLDARWDDTLIPYLRSSNEDEVVLRAFERDAVSVLDQWTTPFCWFEIGPGPGTKTLGFARLLSRGSAAIHKTVLVESSKYWICHLEQTGGLGELRTVLEAPVSLAEEAFGCFAAKLRANEPQPRPSLITMVHVLYDAKALDEFAEFTFTFAAWACREPLLYFVVSEADDSDFAVLREALRRRGFDVPAYDAAAVGRILSSRSRGMFREFRLEGKHCLAPDEAVDDWLAPFLLGCCRESFRELPGSQRSEVVAVIHEHLRTRIGGTLWVPDSVCVAVT